MGHEYDMSKYITQARLCKITTKICIHGFAKIYRYKGLSVYDNMCLQYTKRTVLMSICYDTRKG